MAGEGEQNKEKDAVCGFIMGVVANRRFWDERPMKGRLVQHSMKNLLVQGKKGVGAD